MKTEWLKIEKEKRERGEREGGRANKRGRVGKRKERGQR